MKEVRQRKKILCDITVIFAFKRILTILRDITIWVIMTTYFYTFPVSFCTNETICTRHCINLISPFKKRHTKVKVLVTQSCVTLCDPMDCSPPGSSVRGILQARILEWVAISFSRGSSPPRDWTWVSRHASYRFNFIFFHQNCFSGQSHFLTF